MQIDSGPPRPVRRRAVPILLAVNCLLLIALGAAALGQGVSPLAASRARGQYVVVPGKILGSPTNAIYILDTANEELVAVRWNKTGQRLDGIGFRDIIADAASAGRTR
ncbi:hypothetical protein BH11PLA1_BH11PLA1_15480 [soil metagenome]